MYREEGFMFWAAAIIKGLFFFVDIDGNVLYSYDLSKSIIIDALPLPQVRTGYRYLFPMGNLIYAIPYHGHDKISVIDTLNRSIEQITNPAMNMDESINSFYNEFSINKDKIVLRISEKEKFVNLCCETGQFIIIDNTNELGAFESSQIMYALNEDVRIFDTEEGIIYKSKRKYKNPAIVNGNNTVACFEQDIESINEIEIYNKKNKSFCSIVVSPENKNQTGRYASGAIVNDRLLCIFQFTGKWLLIVDLKTQKVEWYEINKIANNAMSSGFSRIYLLAQDEHEECAVFFSDIAGHKLVLIDGKKESISLIDPPRMRLEQFIHRIIE